MAGDQYSLTIQATDSGGLYTQSIVEVIVIAGPNTKSPVFSQSSYEVTVSEGSPINTTVIPLRAVDPENDPVTYTILSGNDLRQFAIGEKSGIVTVIRKLDREELTRYQLVTLPALPASKNVIQTIFVVVDQGARRRRTLEHDDVEYQNKRH